MLYAYWECFQSYRTTIYFITPPPLKTTVCALLLIINPWAEIQQMPIDSQYNICFMPIENVCSHLGRLYFVWTPPPLKTTVYALLLIIIPWAEIQHMPIDSEYNICFMPIENVSSHLERLYFVWTPPPPLKKNCIRPVTYNQPLGRNSTNAYWFSV